MATRKKAKSRAKGKKTAARKPASRRKTARVKSQAARKKPRLRRAAPKRRAIARPAQAPRARGVSPVPRPAVPGPGAAPIAGEERVGVVTHYYGHLSVAVIRLESGSLRVGDSVHISGHTSDFRQRIGSMQIEHESVSEVRAGQEFGLRVTEHAREHDVVYKVAP